MSTLSGTGNILTQCQDQTFVIEALLLNYWGEASQHIFHQRESTLLYVSHSPKDKSKYFLTFQVSLQFRNKLWMGTRRTLDFSPLFFFLPKHFLGSQILSWGQIKRKSICRFILEINAGSSVFSESNTKESFQKY